MPRKRTPGERNGRLTLIGSIAGSRPPVWRCLCDCGKETMVLTANLRIGHTESCGCLLAERRVTANILHGEGSRRRGTITPEFKVWTGIKRRCLDPTCKSFKDYGARGITLCQEWLTNYSTFVEHVGRRPSPTHTIERIDNERGYEPGNVRWATRAEQNSNTRANRFLEFNGKRQTLSQWSRETGLSHPVIIRRLQRGWSLERSLTQPTNRGIKS